MKSDWFVYILQTAAGTYYTGITTDPERRLSEHSSTGQGGKSKGAKSLRGKGPLKLVYTLSARDRSDASIFEARIKKLSRADKERLVKGDAAVLARLTDKTIKG